MLLFGAFFGRGGLLIALVFALGMNGFAYFFSDQIALRSMRAQPVSPSQAPRLHAIVSEREMRAVLGHELSHVYNRDILTSSVAGALASIVTFLAQLAWFLPMGSDDDEGGNWLGGLLMMVLGPVAASLIQLAISRSREYQADADGASLTGDPLALASALRKLEAGAAARPLPQDQRLVTSSHLMIVNPFRGAGLASMFATHPPMPERIARLEAMAGVTHR